MAGGSTALQLFLPFIFVKKKEAMHAFSARLTHNLNRNFVQTDDDNDSEELHCK